jgi:hypothetical protein
MGVLVHLKRSLPSPVVAGQGLRLQDLAVGLIVGASLLTLGVAMVAHASLDPDESQHLHAAWLVAQGRVPYADFWEHHMPLLYYALAPVTRWFAERPAVYFAGRAIMSVTAVGTLVVLHALGRHFGPGVGAAAVTVLVVQLEVLQHIIEVRPDGPALLTWLATLLMLVQWREREGAWRLWGAGLGLGLTATLTPKAAFVGLGAAAVVLTGSAGPTLTLGRMVRQLGWLAAGCAVPMAALLGWLTYTGGTRALWGFWQDVIVTNLYFPDFVKQAPVGAESIGFVVLALAGIVVTLRRHGRRVLQHPLHGPLLIPLVVVSGILILPSTPAAYSYTWLPVVAGGSLYAGQAFVAAVERRRAGGGMGSSGLVALATIGAFVVPAVVIGVLVLPHNRDNDADVRLMSRELAYACPGEAVLDGRPLAVFRPTALRYHSLPRGLRIWIADGVIPGDALVSDLHGARAPVGVLDVRLRKVGGAVTQFITRYYVSEPDGLLVAGASLSLRSGSGEADVDVLVPGFHQVFLGPGMRASIDGADTTGAGVLLSAGPHRISWSGGPGTLRLLVAPCAERHP